MKKLVYMAALAPLMLMAASTESSGGSSGFSDKQPDGKISDVQKSEAVAQVAASQRNEVGSLSETKSNFEAAVRLLVDEAKGNGLEAFDINAVLENVANTLKTPEEQGIETTTSAK